MSLRALDRALDGLRHEPTQKRIRAVLGDRTVLDTTRAAIVWEPRRVVPSYAVPVDDLDGELVPAPPAAAPEPEGVPLGDRMVLDPRIPFAVHTIDGEPLSLRVNGTTLDAVAFRPSDRDLGGLVILDFGAFDAWYEEDERNVSHPRDPFHRIDIVRSSRHVRVEADGAVLRRRRVDLPGAAARGGRGDGPDRVLQRARRRGRGRRAARAAGHAVVVTRDG
jgi:uncharacterized protein (DUF427 family)